MMIALAPGGYQPCSQLALFGLQPPCDDKKGTRRRIIRRTVRIKTSHFIRPQFVLYDTNMAKNPLDCTVYSKNMTKNMLDIITYAKNTVKNPLSITTRYIAQTKNTLDMWVYHNVKRANSLHATISSKSLNVKRMICDAHPSVDIIHHIMRFFNRDDS